MKKTLAAILSAVLIGTFAAGCAPNTNKDAVNNQSSKEYKTLSIKQQLGDITISKKPEKVVVFDYGALDTLESLNIEPVGVVKDNLPEYLSKYKDNKYKAIGGLKEPNFEVISELQPDLIIISARQSDHYKELSKIAPTMYVGLDTKKYLDSFKSNTTTLAQIFQKEEEGKKKIEAIETRVKEVQEEVNKKAKDKKSLIMLTNDGNISAYGPGSRFALVDTLGFKAVDEKLEASTHGQKIGYEYIKEKNPDYIFIIDRSAALGTKGTSSAKQSLENDLVKSTNAYKEGKMVYLDPSYWYLSGGGIKSMEVMVEEIAKALK